MKRILTIVSLFSWIISNAQDNLPLWGKERFKNTFLDLFAISDRVSPQFLEADFSGDGASDLAIFVESKSSGKKGVLILIGSSDKYFVTGAGNTFGNAGNNFNWVNSWAIFRDSIAYETTFKPDGDVDGEKELRLQRPAISIREEEGSGGLIYFDGAKFIWIHQGD